MYDIVGWITFLDHNMTFHTVHAVIRITTTDIFNFSSKTKLAKIRMSVRYDCVTDDIYLSQTQCKTGMSHSVDM